MNFKFFIPIFIPLFILGCACHKPPATNIQVASEQIISKIPEWFTNPPMEEGYILRGGSATSRDLQLAQDKASESARMNLASSLEIQFQGLSKRFQEEIGNEEYSRYHEHFILASKSAVSAVLIGVTTEKCEIMNENGVYRAYVLLKLPLTGSTKVLLDKIGQDQDLSVRFQATETWKELEKQAK
jgi:hypothetical protein